MANYLTTPSGSTCLAAWDCRAAWSNPTVNGTTGIMTAAGTDFASTGATYNMINTPRADAVYGGMLNPFYNEINTGGNNFGGMEVVFPAGTWHARRLLVVALINPLSLSSVASQQLARIFTTDSTVGSGPFAALSKHLRLSTTPDSGTLNVNAGAGTQRTTVGVAGIEPQVVAYYETDGGNLAFGYTNMDGSENTTGAGAGSTNAITRACFGCCTNASNSLNTNNPFYGNILAFQVFARTSGTNFTEAETLLAMSEMLTSWATLIPSLPSFEKGVCIFGDSRAYTSASQNDTQLTTNTGKVSTTLTGAHAAGVTTLTVAASAAIANGRYTIDPGTVDAETVIVTGRPTGTTVTISPASRLAHSGGQNLVNDYYGFMNPLLGWPMKAKMFGVCSGAVVCNTALAGTQLQTVAATTETTVASDTIVGATSITLTSGTGFSANEIIIISPGTARQEVVKITSVAGAVLTVPAMANAHTAADKVVHDPDGSLQNLVKCSSACYIIQRGHNDIVAGGRTGAQMRADARTMALRARSCYATVVIACKVTPSVQITAGTLETRRTDYNGFLNTDTGSTYWNAVAEVHWLNGGSLSNPTTAPTNPVGITYNDATYGEATAETTINGALYDASGVHERAFLNACLALMIDKAYSSATGNPVTYSPSAVTPSIARVGSDNVLTWSTPASPDAPDHNGNDGPSGLVVVIRRGGTIIAVVAPSAINTVTGLATYTTTYTDTGASPSSRYTLQVVDGAGNTSSEVPIQLPTPNGTGRTCMMLDGDDE